MNNIKDFMDVIDRRLEEMGDNRNNSEDSRSGNIGPVKKELIEGRAWFKLTMNDSYMGFIDRE